LSRLRESGLRHALPSCCIGMNQLQGVVEFLLRRAFDQVQAMQHQRRKSQCSVASKIGVFGTVPGNKFGRMNQFIYAGISIFKLDLVCALWVSPVIQIAVISCCVIVHKSATWRLT